MNNQKLDTVLIVHGWSDSPSGFERVAKFLKERNLYSNIHFVKYKSLDDQASLDDFADKMEQE